MKTSVCNRNESCAIDEISSRLASKDYEMSVLRELRASQYSIDMDFLPNPDSYTNFVPRKPPDIDKVLKDADFIQAHPKEDLESSYYRCFNWVHVHTCNLNSSLVVSCILFLCLIIDLFVTGPTIASSLLTMHIITFTLAYYGGLKKNPRFYYPHIILNGSAAVGYALIASILLMASLVIIGSESTKNRLALQIDINVYMSNGIMLAILASVLYYLVNVCFRDFEYLRRIEETLS